MKPTEDPIGLFVTRTAKTLSKAFDDALAERGGSLPAWLVLASLTGDLHQSQRAIADAVGVEGATLTHHLNRMEAAGLAIYGRRGAGCRDLPVRVTRHAGLHNTLRGVRPEREAHARLRAMLAYSRVYLLIAHVTPGVFTSPG